MCVIEAALQIGHTRRTLVSCVRKRQGRGSARRPIRALFLTITSARAVGGQGQSCQLNPLNETLSPSCTLLHRLRIPAHTCILSSRPRRLRWRTTAATPTTAATIPCAHLPPPLAASCPPRIRCAPICAPWPPDCPRMHHAAKVTSTAACLFCRTCHRRSSFALCPASPATPQRVAFPVPLPCT